VSAAAPPQPAPARDLALTLSGGGFRATLFHLGVVRFLYEKELLPRVGQVCSVSGGSILAAHLAVNWDRYTADTEKFKAAADDLAAFIRSDLRGRVVRGWLFSYLAVLPRLWQRVRRRERWQRITLLERWYAAWLRDKKTGEDRTLAALGKQAEGSTSPPELTLLATSMTTGRLCWFDRSGFHWIDREKGEDGKEKDAVREVLTGKIPLALAVAASSAFPPLFPPLRIDNQRLACSQEQFPHTERLTDGGVYENLGIRMLRGLHQLKPLDFKYAVISDAQLQFDWDLAGEYSWLLSRANRSTDILMDRITDLESDSAQAYFDGRGVSLVDCAITAVVPSAEDPTASDEGTQRQSAHVRTDLDRFSDLEIDTLVRQGYVVARSACERAGLVPRTPADKKGNPWSPVDYTPRKGDDLGQSAKLRWQLFKGDRYSWINLALALYWLGLVIAAIDVGASFANRGVLTWWRRPVRVAGLGTPELQVVTWQMKERMPPTERIAYDRLYHPEKTEYLVVRLRTKPFSEVAGHHRIEQRLCRLVYHDRGERRPLDHFAFRVHPGDDGRDLYEGLKINPVDKAGEFSFTVPPSAPDDFLLILCSVGREGEDPFPPQDLSRLVRLEYP
jgi:predicted acylesterase/phospholipase RssA